MYSHLEICQFKGIPGVIPGAVCVSSNKTSALLQFYSPSNSGTVDNATLLTLRWF